MIDPDDDPVIHYDIRYAASSMEDWGERQNEFLIEWRNDAGNVCKIETFHGTRTSAEVYADIHLARMYGKYYSYTNGAVNEWKEF
jgi:hypothetical protein